jgi:hypothetical protein
MSFGKQFGGATCISLMRHFLWFAKWKIFQGPAFIKAIIVAKRVYLPKPVVSSDDYSADAENPATPIVVWFSAAATTLFFNIMKISVFGNLIF